MAQPNKPLPRFRCAVAFGLCVHTLRHKRARLLCLFRHAESVALPKRATPKAMSALFSIGQLCPGRTMGLVWHPGRGRAPTHYVRMPSHPHTHIVNKPARGATTHQRKGSGGRSGAVGRQAFVEQFISTWDKNLSPDDDNTRTLLVIEGIGHDTAAKALWQKLLNDNRTGITFDLYYCGIVFFDKRYKQNYIVNF